MGILAILNFLFSFFSFPLSKGELRFLLKEHVFSCSLSHFLYPKGAKLASITHKPRKMQAALVLQAQLGLAISLLSPVVTKQNIIGP